MSGSQAAAGGQFGPQRSGAQQQGEEPERRETDAERLDRNWVELLQELRVSQTGVQLIAGFLLTLPFQDRFYDLDDLQVGVYLALVVLAGLTTGLTMTPISVHRRLFGLHVKDRIVRSGHQFTRAVLGGLALLIVGICFLIFDVVVGRTTAVVVGALVLLALVALLVAVPGLLARNVSGKS
jgi:hypothetical protein